MKKKCLILFCLIQVFSMISVFAINATVVSTLGKAEYQNGTKWEKLSVGLVLKSGTVISTGFKSEAVLKIGESTVNVKALSRLTIEQISEIDSNHNSSVYLDMGAITADVKAVKDKRVGFTVKTPVATASVRGTSGLVKANGLITGTSGIWEVYEPLPKEIITSEVTEKFWSEKEEETGVKEVKTREGSNLVRPGQTIKNDETGTVLNYETLVKEATGTEGFSELTKESNINSSSLISVSNEQDTVVNTSTIKITVDFEK